MDNENIGFAMKPVGPPEGEVFPFVAKIKKYNMIKYIVENEHLSSSKDEATDSILYNMIKDIITEDKDSP